MLTSKRAAIKAGAAAALLAFVLIPLSTVSVAADANPANRGHHYGQLKHRHAPPPVPAPAPRPPVVTAHVAKAQPRAVAPAATTAASPRGTPDLGRVPTGPLDLVVNAPSPADATWWLLLVVAVALGLLWLLIAVLLARAVVRRRNKGQAAAAPAA